MHRGQDGRDEPIIDQDVAIIDAHHHLFDRPTMRYMAEEYLADAQSGHNVIGSVYVEGGAFFRETGPEVLRPLGEVEFADRVGDQAEQGAFGQVGLCAGIVGYCDFRLGSAVGEFFDEAEAISPRRFKGVRQITMDHQSDAPWRFFMSGRPPAGILDHANFRLGFAELAKRDLIFDAAVFHSQWKDIAALVDAFPATSFVLNNLLTAMALDEADQGGGDVFSEWQQALAELAKRENVYCKVSGLGMPFWNLGLEQLDKPIGSSQLATLWKPYVETALDRFGFDRCMAASNFPPDGRSCGFVPLFNALKKIVAGASEDEKAALFSKTANRVYDLRLL